MGGAESSGAALELELVHETLDLVEHLPRERLLVLCGQKQGRDRPPLQLDQIPRREAQLAHQQSVLAAEGDAEHPRVVGAHAERRPGVEPSLGRVIGQGLDRRGPVVRAQVDLDPDPTPEHLLEQLGPAVEEAGVADSIDAELEGRGQILAARDLAGVDGAIQARGLGLAVERGEARERNLGLVAGEVGAKRIST